METAQVELEPERLRLITRSVLALQNQGGLVWAAMGLFFFAFDVKDILPGRFTGPFLTVLSIVAGYLAYRYVPKYYERRFGHVEPPPSRPSRMSRWKAVSALALVVLFLLYILSLFIFPFISLATGRQADVFFGRLGDQVHVLIHDPEHLVRFGPILWCALIASLFPWRRRNRDDSDRLVWAVGALLWLAFFLYPLHDRAIAQLLLWKIFSAGWAGLSFMAMGLYQHMRVVLLLPRRPQAQTDL